MKALVYTSVRVMPESPIEVDFTHAVRVGEIGNDLVLRADPADLERLAAALMLAATNMRMHRMFNDLGITDRAERLAYTSAIVGRPVESSNELTRDEVSRLLNHMARELGEVAPDEEPAS